MNMILQIIMSFFATLAFAVLFNIPKKELLFCGLTGASGWLLYQLALLYSPDAIVGASLAGSIALTVCGRILCYSRKVPVSVYLVSGIIPLVPGAGVYHTMYEMIITGDNMSAIANGAETLKIAGIIAFGIISVLSLPRIFFDFSKKV